jgi:hypothetical protein
MSTLPTVWGGQGGASQRPMWLNEAHGDRALSVPTLPSPLHGEGENG